MTSFSKAGMVAVIVVLIAAVALIQQHIAIQSMEYGPEDDLGPVLPGVPASLPRLLNLKNEVCIQCKRMIPVLAELGELFGDRFTIHTYDVDRNRDARTAFGVIRTLPTLIFMDQSGRELFRFEGYMSKAEVMERWRSLGVVL